MSSVESGRSAVLDALGWEMRKVSTYSVLFSQAVADCLGINSTDLECRDILNWTGPITAGRLAELSGLTTGAITGVLDRLEKAGYVRRERDPHDKRRVIVQPIEPPYEGAYASPFDALQQAISALYDRYSDAELALILDFTARINPLVLEVAAQLRQGAEARRPKRASADRDKA